MYYSYVMGIGNEINNLKDKGFTVEKFGDNYGVSFSKEKANEWKFTSIKDMLKENHFYSDKIIG